MRGYFFKSTLFEIEPGEDEATNPGCYGKQLALWIRARFLELGYPVEDIVAEDYGWRVMCQRGNCLLWIGCAIAWADAYEETHDRDNPPDGKAVIWHVFPTVEVPFFDLPTKLRSLVGLLDTKTPFRKLDGELRQLLENEPAIEFCDEP